MKKTFVIRSQEIADSLARFISGNWREMAGREEPMQAVCSTYRVARQNDQLSVMWAGMLKPLSQQVWTCGRQYDEDTWHIHIKRMILPEMMDDPDHDKWFKADAQLWRYMPDGEREFFGSTGMLTKTGMSEYLQRLEAYIVSEHGVRLPAPPGR